MNDRKPRNWTAIVNGAVLILAIAAMTAGAAWIYAPAGLIVPGAIFAWLVVSGNKNDEPTDKHIRH